MHGAGADVDRAREPDAGAEDRLTVDVGGGDDLVGELDGEVERAGGGLVDVERLRALGEDRARQVGDRDVDLLVAEVDAEHEAGGAVERQQRRRPALLRHAARSAGRLVLDDQAAGLQLGDERRDRRARQARQAGEVGAARAAAAAQRVEQLTPIALPE